MESIRFIENVHAPNIRGPIWLSNQLSVLPTKDSVAAQHGAFSQARVPRPRRSGGK